jgi:hypothetical protein
VIWCDSDDALASHALKFLLDAWLGVETELRCSYIGVIGLCVDEFGAIQSTSNCKHNKVVSSWRDLDKVYGITNDTCILLNKLLIGDHRFPEHDLVMTEAGFWHIFFDKKVVYHNVVLKEMIRSTENKISGSRKMEYCRGKAFAIAYADGASYAHYHRRHQMKIACTFHRYSFHGEIPRENRRLIFGELRGLINYLGFFIGTLYALYDVLRRRVNKTHRVFEAGRNIKAAIYRNYSHYEDC